MTKGKAPAGWLIEIQALRTIAVLLVVMFHLWPDAVRGGYMGVDVFFVISGFLITAHLMRDLEANGRIRLGRFWARRARRLLPAGLLVLALTGLATWWWMPMTFWPQTFREIVASALYFENWQLAHDAVDYLAAENTPSPVQHFWTLSVEEQFYLVQPLLLVAAFLSARKRRGGLLVVLLVVTAVSFAYCVWVTAHHPAAAYFVTPGRVWEFGAGALLAYWRAHRPLRDTVGHVLLSWAGLAAIVGSGLMFTVMTPFPGAAAAIPVLGTVAVIAAGAPGRWWSPRRFMALPPVRAIADVSYSTYLWHWPPIVLLPQVLGRDLSGMDRFGILGGTLVCAFLTRVLVEDPIRIRRPFGMRRNGPTFAFAAAGAALVVAGSFVGSHVAAASAAASDRVAQNLESHRTRCFGAASMDRARPCHNPRLDGVMVPGPAAIAASPIVGDECFQPHADALVACHRGNGAVRPRVLLVGDSHAWALMPAFERLADEKLVSLTVVTKGMCPWSTQTVVRDGHPDLPQSCSRWQAELKAYVAAHLSHTDVVVTTAFHRLYAADVDRGISGFENAWKAAADAGVPIVVIPDNPKHERHPNNCVAVNADALDRCKVSVAAGLPRPDPLVAAAHAVAGTHVLNLTDFYCRDGECPAVIGGVNVYRDRSHITPTYARTLAPYIYRGLLDEGLLH